MPSSRSSYRTRRRITPRGVLAIVSLLATLPAHASLAAQSGHGNAWVADTVASGLPVPRSLVFVSPDTLLVAFGRFRLALVDVRSGGATDVTGGPPPITPRNTVAETGIFDIALHPDFSRTGTLYLSHAVGTPTRTSLAVLRARLVGTRLTDTTTILEVAAWDTSEAHYGGRLALREGYLFLTVGERESRRRVADLATHVGKILRVREDGRAPDDNPFVGRAGARPEIWSYGHRNAQAMTFDSAGVLWSAEHGPRHGDELNRIEPGRDYGWPRVSFGHEYLGGAVGSGFTTDSANTLPVWVWTPAIAPSDMIVYSGRLFPAWRGNLLITSLNSRRHLNRTAWDGERIVSEERLGSGLLGRLRSLVEGADGAIFLGNDAGQILRLRPQPQ